MTYLLIAVRTPFLFDRRGMMASNEAADAAKGLVIIACGWGLAVCYLAVVIGIFSQLSRIF